MAEIRFERDCSAEGIHLHDEMEILYVLSGRIGIFHAGKNHLLKDGQFLVLNPFESHELFREAGGHTLSLYIASELLREVSMPKVFCCSSDAPEKEEYCRLLRSRLAVLYQNWKDGGASHPLYARSILFGMLDVLEREFPGGPAEEESGGKDIAAVLKWLNEHYRKEITLSDAAAACFVSEGYLSRKFTEVTGEHFSDYLRRIRLQRAESLLVSTDLQVTQIAAECGFSGPNTFISNFTSRYHMTPGKYRRQHADRLADKTPGTEIEPSAWDIGLLRYADAESIQILSKKHMEPVTVSLDLKGRAEVFPLVHKKAASQGYLAGMLDPHTEEVSAAYVRETGTEYLILQGIFDDTLHVYRKGDDGSENYDYYLLDLALDAALRTGAKPWLELSHTPGDMTDPEHREYFLGGYTSLPEDLDAWQRLLESFFGHALDRYGREEVRKWRFSVSPALYVSYGLYSMDAYLEYYRLTMNTAGKMVPGTVISGGTFDAGLLQSDGTELLEEFLVYAKQNGCLPDLLSIQDFNVDYSSQAREEVDRNITDASITGEPVPPSENPDQLADDLAMIRAVTEKCGLGNLPLGVIYWGSTMWNMDLGNDTCWQAAYITKNCMENLGRCECLAVPHIEDLDREMAPPFHGGTGVMTQGIPKAAWNALFMMSELETGFLVRKPGIAVSASQDRARITILLWHYCLQDFSVHLSEVLPLEEQLTIDRYYSYTSPGVLRFQITIRNMEGECWQQETYRVCREHGSSFDLWRAMGAPAVLTQEQKRFLKDGSLPGYTVETIHPRFREVLFSETLDEHEVRLIVLEKR